jgi:hypothetical protein
VDLVPNVVDVGRGVDGVDLLHELPLQLPPRPCAFAVRGRCRYRGQWRGCGQRGGRRLTCSNSGNELFSYS